MVVGIAACIAIHNIWDSPYSTDLYNFENQEFLRYITKYGKSYATKEEFAFRANLFQLNMQKID